LARISRYIKIDMKFTERIKQLRDERQLPQKQFIAALENDTATYCKIANGEWHVKAEQDIAIAELLQTGKDGLLALWLADQIFVVFEDEQKVADKGIEYR